ncbi:unnamed protein product [Tilletia laevis]|uniref:Uncharacterized protein n=2 Tax=Tilletia TaxID=13289 RepID=A0A177TSS2_9BASI|nr:hypothetical protein CF336_g8053 [Tilletia laevis]KAE8245732.1 hypothetical protein A4X03_0g7438 [Tilletia caries]CAD6905665.1 unnamed protein product [Tilletia controversa]KAE8185980.1 hypothetical protein CF335_g7573 [Tilletia laevis]CAD6886600.1 unnamed protein product [Tilletia caries]
MKSAALLLVALTAGQHAASVAAASLPLTTTTTPAAEAVGLDELQLQTQREKQQHVPGRFGKFLHITDLHPDSHYTAGAKISKACHISHKKEKKNHGGKFPPISSARALLDLVYGAIDTVLTSELVSQSQKDRKASKNKAGHWGSPDSICDSPPALITGSLRWITENWLTVPSKGKAAQHHPGVQKEHDVGFDFVLVTGDLARHDVDAQQYPRTLPEIYRANRWTMEKIEQAFPDIPIIPCVGNNDIWPHNIMNSGPSAVTRELSSIWSKHIPEFELHNFQRGAYFAKEVIPNELAVLSLNTIYLYDSNKVVDGCVKSKKGKPEKDRDAGTVMLDWMEVQLSLFRSRHMQVHLMGHVPPTAGNYFPLCYERYTDIVLRYQDTVVGQHYGHMNVDAFFVQEDEEAVMDDPTGDNTTTSDTSIHISSLADDLQNDYATLPGRKRTNLDYYHTFFATPSIVPTFLPTIRVYTYNNTRSAKRSFFDLSEAKDAGLQDVSSGSFGDDDDDDGDDDQRVIFPTSRSHRRRHRKHKRKKHRKKKLPRHASPDSPARTNTYLSMLGYSQWVLDLDRANAEWERRHGDEHQQDDDDDDVFSSREKGKKEEEELKLEYELEYVTYEPETLWRAYLEEEEEGKRSYRQATDGHIPVPKALLDRLLERAGVSPPHYVSAEDGEEGSAAAAAPVADDLDWGQRMRCAFARALTWRFSSSSAIPTTCSAPPTSSSSSDAALPPSRAGTHKLRLPKEVKHLTEYGMASLTVEPMMEFARRLATDGVLWKRFTGRMYQGLAGR